MKFFIVILVCYCFPMVANAEIQTEKQPLAVIPAPAFLSEPVVEGKDVVHDFIIQNQGTDVLKVEQVKTG